MMKSTNANTTSLHRPIISVKLNEAELISIGKLGKFNSFTVLPSERHSLKLQYGDLAKTWTFSVSESLNTIEFQRADSPVEKKPNQSSLDALKVFSPEQVFACEEDQVYLQQSEDFILLLGRTTRLPLKLEAHSSSMLLVSWRDAHDPVTSPPSETALCSVSIYHLELGAYATLSTDTTAAQHYRFTGLEGCTPYVACIDLDVSPSVTCLYTITDPGEPRNAQVTSWNTTQVTVAWDCPRNNKFSFFLLTVLHLNGTDHIVQERTYQHSRQPYVFTAADLPPCSRVQFHLQTVCESATVSRTSRAVMIDGNSAHSAIQSIRQSDAGPENYTLSWTVTDKSLIAVFRVYHQGALHGSTLLTTHTVAGLAPCRRYEARVEAVCGESVVMNARTLQTHTGPRAVSDLLYRADDSTALWSGPSSSSGGAFGYNLTHENGSLVSSGGVAEPRLPLQGLALAPGLPYILQVWGECHGWESPSRAVLCFTTPAGPEVKARQLKSNDSLRSVLAVIVPWRLADHLKDPKSPTRLELERIVQNKISELLKDFPHPISVGVLAFEDYENGTRAKISVVLNASITDAAVPLSSDEIVNFIQTLSPPGITFKNGMLYWDDPDECSILEPNPCPPHSVCINTLDSYTCVCQKGYYDVSPLLMPTTDCREKGLSTQCYKSLVVGSVAKAYLVGHFGGVVTVVLNDGRCPVLESETLYYVRVPRHPSHCGTNIVVNDTHIEVTNALSVTAGPERIITRRDLKVIWKCIYPSSHLVNTKMNLHLDWTSSYSLVEYNSSRILEVDMAVFSDDSYTYSYTHAVTLLPEDVLYLEVALRAHNTFASDLLLEVDTCWATESTNPQDKTKGILLRDGCPVDRTFQWLSVNGAGQTARFSVQMFSMPAGRPFYIHCLTRVCAPNENCTTMCPAEMLSRGRRDIRHIPSAVVTAGPLMVSNIWSTGSTHSKRKEAVTLLTVLVGSIGFLVFTFIVVTATKTLLSHYGRVYNQ